MTGVYTAISTHSLVCTATSVRCSSALEGGLTRVLSSLFACRVPNISVKRDLLQCQKRPVRPNVRDCLPPLHRFPSNSLVLSLSLSLSHTHSRSLLSPTPPLSHSLACSLSPRAIYMYTHIHTYAQRERESERARARERDRLRQVSISRGVPQLGQHEKFTFPKRPYTGHQV